ncbi:MAG: antibiotic biosynthesis monooxygenase [Bacteroidales bacterium]|nr:antibiotic biosynthesis monooxygenase [Bacteroidales bacterium]
MTVTIVHIYVKTEHRDEFILATVENHNNSVREPGNLRFDVLQNEKEPDHFILYEAYRSEEDAAKHKETEHYLKWKETVAGWMAKPREGIKHRVISLQ